MPIARPPHPGDLVPLDDDECIRRLHEAPWARIAFTDPDGEPQVLPVSHLLYEGAVAFRTSPGSLLGLAVSGQRVAVQVDGGEIPARVGWSVLAIGTASMISASRDLERLHALPFEPWATPAERTFWVRVEIERLTGRRIVRHA